MEVTYGESTIAIPKTANHTEITTYMWPGFLAEFYQSTGLFDTWELVGATRWRHRPDIIAPPFSCLGVDQATGYHWITGDGARWLAYPDSTLWRKLWPTNTALPQMEIAPA